MAAIPSDIGNSYSSSWLKEAHESPRECVGLVSSVMKLVEWRGVVGAPCSLSPEREAELAEDNVGSGEGASVRGLTAAVESPAGPSGLRIRSMARDLWSRFDGWPRCVSESCVKDVRTLCILSTDSCWISRERP